MNVVEIDDCLESIDKIDILLREYKEAFDTIDMWQEKLKANALSSDTIIKEAISQLTGIYMGLSPVAFIAVAKKRNMEAVFFANVKNDIEQKGEKVVLGQVDKEVQLLVAKWRKTRAIFQGYLSSCEKGILTCQSLLKYNKKEGDFNGVAQ